MNQVVYPELTIMRAASRSRGRVAYLVHHEREVAENVAKGTLTLVDHPKLDLSLEKKRRHDSGWEQLDEVSIK